MQERKDRIHIATLEEQQKPKRHNETLTENMKP